MTIKSTILPALAAGLLPGLCLASPESAPGKRIEVTLADSQTKVITDPDKIQVILRQLEDLQTASDAKKDHLLNQLKTLKIEEASKNHHQPLTDIDKTVTIEKISERDPVEVIIRSSLHDSLSPWDTLSKHQNFDKSPKWFLGIHIEGTANSLGLKIKHVMEGTPAEKAGLQKNDIILNCNGLKISDQKDLISLLQVAKDQPLNILVKRANKEEHIKVIAAKREVHIVRKNISHPGIFDSDIDEISIHKPTTENPTTKKSKLRLHYKPKPKATKSSPDLDDLRKDNEEIKKLLQQLSSELQELKKKN